VSDPTVNGAMRHVYCVMSARSLPYAQHAFDSLFANVQEPIDLHVITDEADDKVALHKALSRISLRAGQQWQVHAKAEADELAEAAWAEYPAVRGFRNGHPCWRKITDPALFAKPGEEMVILDPDLYFPNHFRFETTPAQGVALMRQIPHCLLPHEVVVAAYEAGYELAHHTDIGVAQLRAPLDLPWLERLVTRLGGTALPRQMHVESIVWAAMALHIGGGYLDPTAWHCWHNAQWKRVALKLGMSGSSMLEHDGFGQIKCFHGGGIAKWWIPQRLQGKGFAPPADRTQATALQPYVQLMRADYDAGLRLKAWARRLGYYKFVK
jgi:hypothetical protein